MSSQSPQTLEEMNLTEKSMVRETVEKMIVLGDLNAKFALWEEDVQDARGEYLVDWIATLVMVVINEWGSQFL